MDPVTYMHVIRRFDNHGDTHLLDALVEGVSAEAAEVAAEMIPLGRRVDRENMLLECGDVAWGLARLAWVSGLPSDVLCTAQTGSSECEDLLSSALRLVVEVGQFAGVMEKAHRHNGHEFGPPASRIAGLLPGAWSSLSHVVVLLDSSMPEVLQGNVDKLTARYEDRAIPLRGNDV